MNPLIVADLAGLTSNFFGIGKTMNDHINTPPSELIEIERFIGDLIGDVRHPINDRRHPQHHEYVKAFNELMTHADSLRNNWLTH
jgi:hypothetical protein